MDILRRKYNSLFHRVPEENIVVVLVGGSGEFLQFEKNDFLKLAADLEKNAENEKETRFFILSSRRTGLEGKGVFERLQDYYPNIYLDYVLRTPDYLYDVLLASADQILVTADSFSMISEALATGCPVTVHGPKDKMKKLPFFYVLDELRQEGVLGFFDGKLYDEHSEPYNELPEVAQRIVDLLRLDGRPFQKPRPLICADPSTP